MSAYPFQSQLPYNQNMRFRISFVLLSLVTSVSPLNQAFADSLRCSDLSEHEAVLKEGRNHLDRGGLLAPLSIPDGSLIDAMPDNYTELISAVVRWKRFMESANTALLDTPTQIKSAKFLARYFETQISPLSMLQDCAVPPVSYGVASILEEDPEHPQTRYSQVEKIGKGGWSLQPALRLYQRMLDSPPWKNETIDFATKSDVEQAITRIKTFQSAEIAQSKRNYPSALHDYSAFVTQVKASPELDLETRSKLLGNVSANITSDFIHAEPASAELMDAVTTQRIAAKKGLQCLQMAEELNATGGKLEAQLSWDLALKMYNEALAIRIKNIGPDSDEAMCETSTSVE